MCCALAQPPGRSAVDPTPGSITLVGGDEMIAGSCVSETLRGCPHDRTLCPCRRRRRAATGSCLLTTRPDPTRSGPKLARSRSISVYRGSASQVIRKEGFSRHMARSARYRPECNQTVGRLPDCGKTRIENRQRNLNRASGGGLASRHSWAEPTQYPRPCNRLSTGRLEREEIHIFVNRLLHISNVLDDI